MADCDTDHSPLQFKSRTKRGTVARSSRSKPLESRRHPWSLRGAGSADHVHAAGCELILVGVSIITPTDRRSSRGAAGVVAFAGTAAPAAPSLRARLADLDDR